MSDIPESDATALNSRAFGALMGFSENPQADLVALLRSGVTITETVRDELANAIESKTLAGVKLEFRGHQAQQRRLSGLDDRKEWLNFGKSIFPFVTGKKTIEAFDLASETFGQTESYCKKCFYYYKNYRDWSETARQSGETYALMTDEELQHVWHISSVNQGKDMKPEPPTGPEYDTLLRDRVAFFRSLTKGPKPWPESTARMFLNVMLIYCDIAPPD